MIEDKTPHRTSLADLGEFGLIDRLTEGFENHNPSTLKGVGDDAAVMDFKDKKRLSLPTYSLKAFILTLAMYH